MAECTHTSETMFGARRSKGRGSKLWAGKITVSDSETLDTGMDHVEGAAFITVEATNIGAASGLLWIKSISGGTITFMSGALAAYANMTDDVAYGIVVGRVN